MLLLLIYMNRLFFEVLLGHTCKVFIIISNLFHYIVVFLNVMTKLLNFHEAIFHHESIVYCFRDFWFDQVHVFKILAIFLLLLFLTILVKALLI